MYFLLVSGTHLVCTHGVSGNTCFWFYHLMTQLWPGDPLVLEVDEQGRGSQAPKASEA